MSETTNGTATPNNVLTVTELTSAKSNNQMAGGDGTPEDGTDKKLGTTALDPEQGKGIKTSAKGFNIEISIRINGNPY